MVSSRAIVRFAITMMPMDALGELRIKNPMIDPRLFKNPSFTASAIAAFCLSAGLYSLLFYLTLYLQNFLGFGSLQAGLRFLPMSALVLVGAPLSGRLSGKFGPKWLLVTAMGLMSIAVFLMARISPSDNPTDRIVLLPGLIIAGIGSPMANPPLSSLAMGTVHPSKIGMASGVSNVSRQLGISFGIAFLGAMLANQYNMLVHNRILQLNAPGLPDSAKHSMVQGIQKAGPIAGSLGLKSAQNPYQNQAIFPTISHIARISFVDGITYILIIAGCFLAIGFLCALFMIRQKDMFHASGEGHE